MTYDGGIAPAKDRNFWPIWVGIAMILGTLWGIKSLEGRGAAESLSVTTRVYWEKGSHVIQVSGWGYIEIRQKSESSLHLTSTRYLGARRGVRVEIHGIGLPQTVTSITGQELSSTRTIDQERIGLYFLTKFVFASDSIGTFGACLVERPAWANSVGMVTTCAPHDDHIWEAFERTIRPAPSARPVPPARSVPTARSQAAPSA